MLWEAVGINRFVVLHRPVANARMYVSMYHAPQRTRQAVPSIATATVSMAFVTNLFRAPTQLLIFVAFLVPQNPPFGGPSPSHSSQICPDARPIACFCWMSVSAKSTVWSTVSSAFVTNFSRAPAQLLVFVVFLLPIFHLLVGCRHRIRHKFVPRAHPIVFRLLHICFLRIHLLVGRLHRIRQKFAPRADPIACFRCIFVSPESTFGGPSPSHSSQIYPARSTNCLFSLHCCFPKIALLVDLIHRIRHKSTPHARPIGCFVVCLFPHIPRFGGPSPWHSSQICPCAHPICCSCCISVSPGSTIWWAVSIAFITNLPRVLSQLVAFVASVFLQNPPFGGPSPSHSSQICPARPIAWLCCMSVSPECTFWWAVSIAFVTNLPDAPSQLLVFIALLFPEMFPEMFPENLPENLPEILPEMFPEMFPEHLPDILPENLSEILPEMFPEMFPENLPEKFPENFPEFISEFDPKCSPKSSPKISPKMFPETNPHFSK